MFDMKKKYIIEFRYVSADCYNDPNEYIAIESTCIEADSKMAAIKKFLDGFIDGKVGHLVILNVSRG